MMKNMYHGSNRVPEGREFWLVPGPNNAYGLGVYFTPDPEIAASYGPHIIVVRDNGRIGFIRRAPDIYIVRGALKLRVRYKKRIRRKGIVLYYCNVVERYSLEVGGSIMEKKIYPRPQEWEGRIDPPKKKRAILQKIEWDSPLNWPDPAEPTIIDRLLGKALGLALKATAFVRRITRKPWHHLEWLGHYLLGSGRPKELTAEEMEDLMRPSTRIAPLNNGAAICRPDPHDSPEWFNTLGTYRLYKKPVGEDEVEIKLFDLYQFGRQPGQGFTPDDIKIGGAEPMIWATSAFYTCKAIRIIVKALQVVSRAARMNMHVLDNEGLVLISNGFWKALGGRPFITRGKIVKER